MNSSILFAALCLIVLSATSPARAGNLTANGSFEDPQKTNFLATLDAKTRDYYAGTKQSPFESWAFGGHYEKGDYIAEISDTAHTGKQSCKITCVRKGRAGLASPPAKLKAGATIDISFWAKAQDANGGRIFLNLEGSPGDGWTSKDLKTGTFDWTHFSHRAKVKGNPAEDQTIVAFIYTTCEGVLWIDDFTLEPADANTPDDATTTSKKPKHIPEPEGSIGYRINIVSPLEKIFQSDDYAPSIKANKIDLAAARNEYESAQLVIEAPWRPIKITDIQFTNLTGPANASIPASALKWERVDYIQTTITPPYFTDHGLGSYPDPLLPAGPFTVEALSRTPIWITIKTPNDCPAGAYVGSITITPDRQKPTTIPINLKIWNFALTDQTHLKTLTWLGTGAIRDFYNYPATLEGDQKHARTVQAYENILLEHRLGPGGDVAAHLNKNNNGYDFKPIDATLERLMAKGMNCFIIAAAPNLHREKKTEYTPAYIKDFTENIKAYADHLREKGWADKAYVYVYDEAPKAAWPEVKKIDAAIKAAAPDARILQCLNEPEGVKELTGFSDVFDVYVTQYHKAGVAASQKKGAEVWLATCCYPMDHPNLFIEYPLLDVRATFWICWKYQANGFEYWSPNAWGVNAQAKGDKWPKVPWVANAFGKYNGDGYLLYPGPDGVPYSSIRFEAFRDGLEDYEYLWTLSTLLTKADASKNNDPALKATIESARKLLSIDPLVKPSGAFSTTPADYIAFRARLAEAIVDLKAALEH